MFARSRFYTPPVELLPPSDWHQALKRLVVVLRRDDIRTVDALLAFVSKDYVTSRIVAQLMFQWLPRAKRSDGLVYKSGTDWQAETGISESQVKTRKSNGSLEALGVYWTNKLANKLHTSHYGIDAEVFIGHVARCVGRKVYQIKAIVFDKVINRPDPGADSTIPRGESPVSLTDNHNQSQLVGSVNNDSSLSGKILDMSDPLILKLIQGGLKRKDFSERYRQLPMDVIEQCIRDTKAAADAKEIKFTVNAYLRGALENQLKALETPSVKKERDGILPVPTVEDEVSLEFLVPEKCLACGEVPHWFSKKCGCAERILPEASQDDVMLDNGWTALDAWKATYNQLELQLDKASFDSFLRPAEYCRVDDGVFVVAVHNDYARDMLQHRLYRNVRRVLSDVAGKRTELIFEIKG